MAPSARPSASTAEKKASGGDETTVLVLVVVVVVVVVLLAGLVAVWFRFYGKKRPVDSGVEANSDGPGTVAESDLIRYNDDKDDGQLF